jgi:transcriptional regulator with XRE-family HTH domain
LIEQWELAARNALQVSRKDKKLSQREVAERMSWTVDIVSNIEKGRRKITLAEFIVFARQCDIDPQQLFRRVLRW